MPEDYEYDAFLSHSSTDKTLVREIAKELEARGVKVWFEVQGFLDHLEI